MGARIGPMRAELLVPHTGFAANLRRAPAEYEFSWAPAGSGGFRLA